MKSLTITLALIFLCSTIQACETPTNEIRFTLPKRLDSTTSTLARLLKDKDLTDSYGSNKTIQEETFTDDYIKNELFPSSFLQGLEGLAKQSTQDHTKIQALYKSSDDYWVNIAYSVLIHLKIAQRSSASTWLKAPHYVPHLPTLLSVIEFGDNKCIPALIKVIKNL